MARRSAGEGSVYQSEGFWVAVLELPSGPSGKRVRRKRKAKTKTEALAKLRAMRRELGTTGSTGDSNRLINDTLADYLAVRRAEDIAPRTLAGDEWMISVIRSGLGRRRLTALKVIDVDRFLAQARDGLPRPGGATGRPIGRSALRRIRSTLVRAIKNDMRLGFVLTNVAELSVMPGALASPAERRSLTHEELDRLCRAASGPTGILIDFIGRNGLRPSEARAMRWSNIDLDAMTMTINCQLNARDEFTDAKTRKAYRTIALDEITADKLGRWQANQALAQEHAHLVWQDLDVVASTATGRPIQRNNLGRSIRRLCKRLGIDPPISPYELRHTAISLQADAGHAAFLIADWAGTSERMISDIYRHRLSQIAPLDDWFQGVSGRRRGVIGLVRVGCWFRCAR